jgi:hypothetical protein
MKKIIIIIISIVSVFSCEKTIPIDMEQQDPKIVINALFDNTKAFTASISKSAMIDDVSGPQPITNATVKLFENGSHLDDLNHAGDGLYVLNDTLKPGNTYQITVDCDLGYASATTIMPEATPIISVDSIVETQIIDDVWGETMDALMFYFTFQDQPGNQYYSLDLFVKSPYETFTDTDFGNLFYYEYNYRSSSSGFDETSSVEFYDYLRFTDGLFNQELKTYKFGVLYDFYDIQSYIDNDYKFILRFYTLNESFYTYLQTLEAYYNAEGDFFAESINLYSNVEGGLGIFAGATYYEADADMTEIIGGQTVK